jgi:hypothetical protein
MTSIMVSLKGRPSLSLSFPSKPEKVTIREVKAAITAKLPKVRISMSAFLGVTDRTIAHLKQAEVDLW